MLNFLENHDEQRIASDFFAGNATKALPALIVSACMNTNPMMIYFGQELGEPGMESEGFSGRDGRTTIFDYWSIDSIRRWNNHGRYNEHLLNAKEKRFAAFLPPRTEPLQQRGCHCPGMFLRSDVCQSERLADE